MSGGAARLRTGRQTLTTFVMVPRLESVELLAAAGFGAALFDLEHAPIDVAELPALAAACCGAAMTSLVRTSTHEAAQLAAILDCGIDGIIVPHVEAVDEARAVVAACRYPPHGSRSLNPYVRALQYGRTAPSESNPLVLAMIEGTGGLADAAEIAVVEGLDGIFVGPFDLAAAIGRPGEPEHPDVVDQVRGLLDIALGNGRVGAVYAHSTHAARRWFEAGATLVALSTDTAMMATAFASAVSESKCAP